MHRTLIQRAGPLLLSAFAAAAAIALPTHAAEGRLAALSKACFFGCDAYSDLKAAVASFKADGNRYVAAP